MDSDEDRRRDRFKSERLEQNRASRDYRDAPATKRKREDDYIPTKAPKPVVKNDLNAPVIKTYKQWVLDQTDLIQPSEANKGYTTYKAGERKKHIENFFIEHKDEDWFRKKYHPEDSEKFKKDREQYLRQRFFAWKKMNDAGHAANLTFDLEHQEKLAKIMDSCVMMMEGSCESDATNFFTDGELSCKKVINLEETELDKSDELEKKDENDTEDGEVMDTKRPKNYKSLFIKSLSPKISQSDLESVGKRYLGFVRATCELIPSDKKFNRRAWITFTDDVNIREIKHGWNNTRIKDEEFFAEVNKETQLKDRIRTIPGLSNHSAIAFRDLKLACKVCEIRDKLLFDLDEEFIQRKKNSTDSDGESTDSELDENDIDSISKKQKFWENGVNPLYLEAQKFIHEYEDTYTERLSELLDYSPANGKSKDNPHNPKDEEELLDIDAIEDILSILDPLLLYMRIVHSIDFYAQSDLSSFEDEHPSRCGICHVRAPIPARGVSMKNAKEFAIKFSEKIEETLTKNIKDLLDESEAKPLGWKDLEFEVDKFIEDNCQQIDADKYLCPLSGKKFRGKEYVKKHIMNKHTVKVENVKKEVMYFNAYVTDRNKDGPSEPRFNLRPTSATTNGYNNNRSSNYNNNNYNNRPNNYSNNYNNNRNYENKPRNDYSSRDRGRYQSNHYSNYSNPLEHEQIRRASGGRGIVDYRDLDAPENMDMFG